MIADQPDSADPAHRRVGTEARKTLVDKYRNGFIDRYLSGAHVLDIGYQGYKGDAVPIVPQAIGIDLNYPGYDGRVLPFPDNSQDAIFSSHCLEHIEDYRYALREWHRVLRIGGFMVVTVPHQFLYEKKASLPSRWNQDHRRFYTPASLLAEVEESLEPNTYRLRHLMDNDDHFTYSLPPSSHSGGGYEIEMVLEKIAPPWWNISNLEQVDVPLQSGVIEWCGFAPFEAGARRSSAYQCSLRFNLDAVVARTLRSAGSEVTLLLESPEALRIRSLLNGKVIQDAAYHGSRQVLEVPTVGFRHGVNTLQFELGAEGAAEGQVPCFAIHRIIYRHPPWSQPQPHLLRRLLNLVPGFRDDQSTR
jgi:SAM-dependent methyltransferase